MSAPTPTTTPDPPPKRMRVSRACEQCRSRKAKCDGKTPTCSPCVTLSQNCTYGAQPRKRGLPPGSVSALERSVKLLQRVLGLLVESVDGAEGALLALVKRRGVGLFDDGEEGRRLCGVWKEGVVHRELEGIKESVLGGGTGTRTGTGAGTGMGGDGRSQEVGEMGPIQLSEEYDGFRDAVRAMAAGSEARPPPPEDTPNPRRPSVAAVAAVAATAAATTANGDEATTEMDWVKESQSLQPDLTAQKSRETLPLIQNTPLGTDHGSSTASSYPRRMRPPAAAVTPPLYTPLDSGGDDHQFNAPEQEVILPTPTHTSFQPLSYTSESPIVETTAATATDPYPPLPQNARTLLDIYFAYTHVWFPILDKYDLVRFFHIANSAGTTKRKASPPKADIPASKRALLYAVLALASLQHDALTYTLSTTAATLYIAAQSILFAPGAEAPLEHIQALLLMALINLSQKHTSTAYLLNGHAGCLATTTGLPTATDRFSTRTWAGHLILETLISTLTPYPPHLPPTSSWAKPIDEDGWEEWEHWKEHPSALHPGSSAAQASEGDPARILSTFNALSSLTRILGSSQHKLSDLHTWCRELPPHCSFDVLNPHEVELPALVPSSPHMCVLHLFYARAIMARHENSAARSSVVSILEAFSEARNTAVAPALFGGLEWEGANRVREVLVGGGIVKAAKEGGDREREIALPRVGVVEERGVVESRRYSSVGGFGAVQGGGGGSLLSPRGEGGEGEGEYVGGGGSQASLGFSQPSPDGFDEEMGMLECLHWTQAGIPEFISNLGYVGGFPPLDHAQAPLQILGLRQDADATYSNSADDDIGGGAAGRRGMSSVLEQWLGGGGGGQGGRWG